MSKYMTDSETAKHPTKRDLKGRLKAKGWTIMDAADYLGVSRQRLYYVFADPGRINLWECAIEGIPVCTSVIKKSLLAKRQARPKALSRPKAIDTTYQANDEVVAMAYAGIAEEGEKGWIADIRGQKDKMELLVRMPGGRDWFPVHIFEDLFVTNGKTHHGGNHD